MSESQHLSEALLGLFANAEHGWFTPISVAIEGLSANQAAAVPAPRFNSVWAVVNHVTFWQEFTLRRVRGEEVDRAALDTHHGWPPVGDPNDEAAWAAARERALDVNKELASAVGELTEEKLVQPYAPGRARYGQIIQGIIAHNSYHACEAISIRHMLGLWLERT